MKAFFSFCVTPESIPQSHAHCKSAPAAAFLSPCPYLLCIHSPSPFNLFQTQSFSIALNPSKHLMQILRKSFQGNTQAEGRHTSFFLLLRTITPTLVQSSLAESMHQVPFSFFPWPHPRVYKDLLSQFYFSQLVLVSKPPTTAGFPCEHTTRMDQ